MELINNNSPLGAPVSEYGNNSPQEDSIQHLQDVINSENTNSLINQILSEIWFFFLVMFYYFFIGMFYSLPIYDKGHKRKIILVTGFWGRNLYWKSMYKRMIGLGYSVYPINLGFQVGDIRKKSLILEEFMVKHDINDCFILGHSMGGWIVLGLSNKAKERIAKFFPICTSFRGSYICYTVPMFVCSWQLKPGTKFIDTQQENLKYLSQVKNIFGKEDEIAIPVETCHTGNTEEVEFSEFGHLNLVMSKRGIDFIIKQIEIVEKEIDNKVKS